MDQENETALDYWYEEALFFYDDEAAGEIWDGHDFV